MTIRLSNISFAGTARTRVAVGIDSEAFMFFATAPAAPRRTFFSSVAGVAEGAAAALGAGFVAAGFAAAGFAAGAAWDAGAAFGAAALGAGVAEAVVAGADFAGAGFSGAVVSDPFTPPATAASGE